jgi:hypothetical protein
MEKRYNAIFLKLLDAIDYIQITKYPWPRLRPTRRIHEGEILPNRDPDSLSSSTFMLATAEPMVKIASTPQNRSPAYAGRSSCFQSRIIKPNTPPHIRMLMILQNTLPSAVTAVYRIKTKLLHVTLKHPQHVLVSNKRCVFCQTRTSDLRTVLAEQVSYHRYETNVITT